MAANLLNVELSKVYSSSVLVARGNLLNIVTLGLKLSKLRGICLIFKVFTSNVMLCRTVIMKSLNPEILKVFQWSARSFPRVMASQ